MLTQNASVFVAGHRGMVGSAVVRRLCELGYTNILTRERHELDLIDQASVNNFFANTKIDCVIVAAGKVGGIHANEHYPADFIYENMMLEANIIHASYVNQVPNLLFLGSSCIYPKHSPQPIPESALLSDKLEPTNEPYAIAKIAGIKLCESYNQQYHTNFRALMPCNLYGPGDNFHHQNSHVIPALIRRIHEAKVSQSPTIEIWGSGKAIREFMHVDDLADACLFFVNLSSKHYRSATSDLCSHVNVGTGEEMRIDHLTALIKDVIDYQGDLIFDSSKPDGTQRKVLDSNLAKKCGWQPKIELADGLKQTYHWYIKNEQNIRR